MNKLLIGIVSAFLLVTTLGAGINTKSNAKNTEKPIITYISPVVKGRIHLNVKLGDYVKKGQLIYKLNDTEVQIEKEYAKINLSIQRFIFQQAKLLLEKEAISRSDFQWCIREYNKAKLEEEIALAKEKQYKYYAPFSGTITKIDYAEGTGVPDGGDFLELTKGKVNIDTSKPTKALVTNRWNSGVINLKVKLGDTVKKGQLLFYTDTTILDKQAKIDEFSLFLSKKEFNRAQKLQTTNTTSIYQYITAKNEYYKALSTAKQSRLYVDECYSYAPFDGKVTNITRYDGSGLGQCKPVVELTAI